ncbi:Bud-site selection protein [Phyllosticta capitalensis]|uniref:Bud-site selection protein n=1 Tax=Phyllosticta capitalensis TaxID=121624 RepID=A0ABR1YMZ3_9PEZI
MITEIRKSLTPALQKFPSVDPKSYLKHLDKTAPSSSTDTSCEISAPCTASINTSPTNPPIHQSLGMPKRKRSGASPAHDDDVNPLLARQRSKLLPLLDRSKKQLVKTLKLARGFERQKLSRRLKTAAASANDGATVARVTREIEALKSVRFEALAEVGLGRQLAKVKRVREHEAVPPWVLRAGSKGSAELVGGKEKVGGRKGKDGDDGGEAEGEEGQGENTKVEIGKKEILDLQARLFNAKATREVMGKIVDEVRACLGVLGDEKGGDNKSAKKGKDTDDKKSAKPSKRKEEVESQSEVELDNEELDRDIEEDGADDGDSEDEFAGFSDRIAASSDEEEDDDDNIGVRIPPGYKPTRDLSVTPDPSPAASEDEDEEEVELASTDSNSEDDDEEQHATFSPSASTSTSPPPPTKSKRTELAATTAAPTKSTFIPSLSAVGYISGSDSDASDPEDVDERVAPPRKNRRGQRARQAIWEKKYGEKAAHVQKAQQKAKTDRNAGWDAKRGATDGGARGKGGKGGFQGKGAGAGKFGAARYNKGSGEASGTAANTTALGKRKTPHRDDEGKLHPSWEAKKRLKEQASANVKFEGKKITFD